MPVETLHDVRVHGHHLVAVCRHAGCRHRHTTDLDRLINSVGPGQALLPERGEQHFTDKMRCPSCKRRGMNLWLEPQAPKRRILGGGGPTIKPSEPNYRIINCGEAPYSRHEMIATADNLMVAKEAFYAAAHFYSKHRVTLMQGALLMGDSTKEMPKPTPPERILELRQAEMEMGTRKVPPLVQKTT